MNLILLRPDDFVEPGVVRLVGRRCEHVRVVHRAALGDELAVGLVDGAMGTGRVRRLDRDALELEVTLEREPPPKPDVTLVLALPRPKVLNRTIAAATSLGVRHLALVNAWRVEKSYWKSPKLDPENLLEQRVLGLEQAKDTRLPTLTVHRLFRRFAEDELPALLAGHTGFVAHPAAAQEAPRAVGSPFLLAIGPEGGFIEPEIGSLVRAGLAQVSLGPRVLRVETALAALLGRMLP